MCVLCLVVYWTSYNYQKLRHYDAKTWPVAHPYGTGSERSEVNSGSPQAHARNRSTLIQSWFRRTPLWSFWKLDSLIKNTLFNTNSRRRAKGRPASSMDDRDGFTRTFGTAIPRNIPESPGLIEADQDRCDRLLTITRFKKRSPPITYSDHTDLSRTQVLRGGLLKVKTSSP